MSRQNLHECLSRCKHSTSWTWCVLFLPGSLDYSARDDGTLGNFPRFQSATARICSPLSNDAHLKCFIKGKLWHNGARIMTSGRVLIWRFGNAPAELRKLYTRSGEPDWLAFVPSQLRDSELESVIRNTANTQISQFETPQGDLVYVGTLRVASLPSQAAE